MQAGGLGEAPRPLVEELSNIKSGNMVLPTRNADGSAGPTVVVRCVTRPSEHQAVLLGRMWIKLPNRLTQFCPKEDAVSASGGLYWKHSSKNGLCAIARAVFGLKVRNLG